MAVEGRYINTWIQYNRATNPTLPKNLCIKQSKDFIRGEGREDIRLNPSKTEFIIIGLLAQIKKIPDPSTHLSNHSSSTTFTSDAPVHNFGVTFDPHLSFSNHISKLYRSCFMHIRDLRRIRPMLDFKTASTIATSIVHSKLDYCNSLFLNLDSFQIHRLQLIQHSLERAVTRTPRHHHITPVLKSHHWLKIPERIHFKVLSLAYN